MNAPSLELGESWSNHVITRKMTSELSAEWTVHCLEDPDDPERPCAGRPFGPGHCTVRDTTYGVIEMEIAYYVEDVLRLNDGSLLLFPGSVTEEFL